MNRRPLASHLVTVSKLLVIVAIYPLIGQAQDHEKQAEQNSELTLQQQQSLREILQIRERLGGGLTEQLQDVLDDNTTQQDFGASLKSVMQQPRPLDTRQPPPGQRWLNHPPSRRGGLFSSRPVSCRTGSPPAQLHTGDVVDVVETSGKNEGETVLSSVEVNTVQRMPGHSDQQHADHVWVEFWLDAGQMERLEKYPDSTTLQIKKSSGSANHLPPSVVVGKRPAGEPNPGSARLDPVSPARIQQLRQAARDLERIACDLEDLEMYDDADGLRLKAQHLRSAARRKNGTTDIKQR